jgi:hypothetical protein
MFTKNSAQLLFEHASPTHMPTKFQPFNVLFSKPSNLQKLGLIVRVEKLPKLISFSN